MNKRLLAAISVLALLAGLAPAAAAEESPGLVLLAVQERDYAPGETLDFTVYTFSGGEPAALASLPAVRLDSGPGAGRTIPVSATAPGRYSGSYTVLSADADEHGYIGLVAYADFAQAAIGQTPWVMSDRVHIRLAGPGSPASATGLSVRGWVLECPDGAVRPGSSVTIAVCATSQGAPVLPGDIRFRMAGETVTGSTGGAEVAAESPAPGYFLVRYRIPDQAQSATFYLHADALGTSARYIAQVKLDFFNVIYHELGRSGSRVDFELYVSDRGGAPVNGSAVTVRMNPWRSRAGSVALDLGRTDQKGRVVGLFDPGPGVGEISIDGWANTSRLSQQFSGYVRLTGAARPRAYQPDFYLERTGSEGTFLPGGTAVQTFLAVYSGKPVRLQMMDCYVGLYNGTPEGGVLEGVRGLRVVTDGEGVFSLNLSFPAGHDSYTTISAVGPGKPYSDYYYTYTYEDQVRVPPAAAPAPSAPWANVTFSKALAGRACRISATAPAGGLLAARATWDFSPDAAGNAGPWDVWNTFNWYLQPRPPGGNPLTGQLVLPRHLKSGQNLTAQVSLVNASGQLTQAGFPLTVRPAAATEPEPDLCCITSIFMVNAMLITLLFFNYMAGRRGARKKELEELGADDQITVVLGASRSAARDFALPIKVVMAKSEDCTACGRKIAQGNLAWRCVCGSRYHEHCTGDGRKCPSCGREWKKG